MQTNERSRHTGALLVVSVGIAVLAFVGQAQAAPAAVSVFEANVHAEPNAQSEKLSTLNEDTRISVSEVASDGWRKTRLPDGQVGWIEDKNVRLIAPGEVPLRTAAPESMKPREVQIYIKDLDHLAQLTKSDPPVFAKANSLANRRTTANVFMIGGGVLGGIMTVVGASTLECTGDGCNSGLMYSGLAIMLGGAVVGLIAAPSRSDILDVINDWNQRNPDRQFSLDDEAGQRRH
jgi:Bacterial SH3 domain